MYQEKMEGDDLLALNITWNHQQDDSKTTFKRSKRNNYSEQKQHRQHIDQQNNN